MTTKKIHYLSGLTITIFIGLYLFNHFCSIFGAELHIEVMNTLRLFYRNISIETILLSAVAIQIVSGIKLAVINRKIAVTILRSSIIMRGLDLALLKTSPPPTAKNFRFTIEILLWRFWNTSFSIIRLIMNSLGCKLLIFDSSRC